MEEGVTTTTGSSGLNFVANIKKESSKNATSHIAVISMKVLFRAILGLDIIVYFFTYN
jgi:hypothetical protein